MYIGLLLTRQLSSTRYTEDYRGSMQADCEHVGEQTGGVTRLSVSLCVFPNLHPPTPLQEREAKKREAAAERERKAEEKRKAAEDKRRWARFFFWRSGGGGGWRIDWARMHWVMHTLGMHALGTLCRCKAVMQQLCFCLQSQV
jgi:hypothetical protein